MEFIWTKIFSIFFFLSFFWKKKFTKLSQIFFLNEIVFSLIFSQNRNTKNTNNWKISKKFNWKKQKKTFFQLQKNFNFFFFFFFRLFEKWAFCESFDSSHFLAFALFFYWSNEKYVKTIFFFLIFFLFFFSWLFAFWFLNEVFDWGFSIDYFALLATFNIRNIWIFKNKPFWRDLHFIFFSFTKYYCVFNLHYLPHPVNHLNITFSKY